MLSTISRMMIFYSNISSVETCITMSLQLAIIAISIEPVDYCCELVEKRVEKAEKNWSLLVYKSTHKVFSSTICRWRNIFLTGTESVKEAAKSGIAVTVTDKTDVCNVKILLKVIANYRYCQTCLILLLLLLRCISFWSIFCKWGKNTAYIDKYPKQARKQTVWQLLKNI